ncbi:glycosyltransferase family 4 protein [Cognatiluteimonas profundi]|uniref:glycosyltransferase family 4 protein n=1 Tax=Cognatiluteimonas profundi TaxID=2594501 RepID=UPI00131AF50A|nr:glycosyltransferase family 1 protein [Lysobacter profundi]
MRYAIVTETYPPEINGVALTVQALEDGLRARGHDVLVARPRQDACEPRPLELLVRGLGLPRYPGLRFGLPAARALLAAWQAAPPDAVYIATEGPLGWSAMRAARHLGIPVATGFHTRYDQYMRSYGLPLLQPVAMHWMRRFHNQGQATLVPTQELQDFLRDAGFANPVRLSRAVDTRLFHPARRDQATRDSWGVGADALAVIHVGRLAPEKNLALAVRAFRTLQATRPDARFVLVGDGPARLQLARDNPDFIFCGIRRDEDLARHFASADIFLFPSRTETFGNVTLEAMASGIATIAFDRGAAREAIRDGVHGAAVSDGDEDAFVSACVRLASEPVLRGGMAMAARQAVLRLGPEQVAADFDQLLQALGGTEMPDVALARA